MRKALVVGINDYPTSPLKGCVADAVRMAGLLADDFDKTPNFDVRLRVKINEIGTKAAIRKDLEELFSGDAEVSLFYFSGHGFLDATGGYFVTPDAKAYDEGVGMDLVVKLANASKAKERIIILDCCHAGAFGSGATTTSALATLEEGVSVLTASRKDETAIESNGQGLFTGLLCDGLEGGASDVRGHVTASALYSYVDEALGPWNQRPQFKSNVSRFTRLRRCTPVVPLDILRLIPTYFPTSDYQFPLDPSYEPDADPKHPEHEAVFGHLQKFRGARLLEPVGSEHMYFAAMGSMSCCLTPLGRQYWRLVTEGRL